MTDDVEAFIDKVSDDLADVADRQETLEGVTLSDLLDEAIREEADEIQETLDGRALRVAGQRIEPFEISEPDDGEAE